MTTNSTQKNANEYNCKKCDFICFKQSEWLRHISTRKHLSTEKTPNIKIFKCLNCNKEYKDRSGLWRHKQICKNEQNCNFKSEIKEPEITNDSIKTSDIALIIKEELATIVNQQMEGNIQTQKQNQDFQKQSLEFQQQMFQQMMEFMKQQCTTTNNINNTNNNYTQFNLQVYLNETCKNAMNVDQFIEYLQPTLQELEDTARLGYVEGITRIILRGLKDLEENERPFHCSDLKRETMFVKNNNDIWEKEPEEKPQLMKVVKAISRKNFCNVNAWQKEHPTWRNHDSKQNDQYNKILINSTSGSTEEEQKNSYDKIIKNIVKETVIDRSKKNK